LGRFSFLNLFKRPIHGRNTSFRCICHCSICTQPHFHLCNRNASSSRLGNEPEDQHARVQSAILSRDRECNLQHPANAQVRSLGTAESRSSCVIDHSFVSICETNFLDKGATRQTTGTTSFMVSECSFEFYGGFLSRDEVAALYVLRVFSMRKNTGG